MSAKAFPPYKVIGYGTDSSIEDRTGCVVIESIKMSYHYDAVFEDVDVMQIICDALNGIETTKEESQ
jgi:hypothetical protein